MKRLLLTFFTAIVVLALAACGSGSSDGEKDQADKGSNKDDKITLRVAWWGSEPRHDYTTEVLKMYEEQNPNVKIETEYAAWDDYWKKLAPMAAANSLPDIVQMDLGYFSQYAENNQLADLTPYLDNQIDVSDYSDNYIDGGKIGDKLYGFNAGVNVIGYQYDPELLKSAGIDEIPNDWTWDDYEAMAAKAKEAGLFMDTGMKADVFFNYYLRSQGERFYNEDGTGLGYDDDQLFVDFFTMHSGLVDKGYTPTPDALAQQKGLEDSNVVAKTGIGVYQWSNQFFGLQQVADRPLEIALMPGPGTEKGLFLKPSMLWSMSEHSEHKEEAAKLLDFLMNDIEANKIILGERGVPGSAKVKEELKELLPEAQVQVFEYVELAEENSSPFDGPDPVGAGQIIDLIDNLSEQMNYGQITPEDAAKQFRTQAEGILSQNK